MVVSWTTVGCIVGERVGMPWACPIGLISFSFGGTAIEPWLLSLILQSPAITYCIKPGIDKALDLSHLGAH